MTRRVNARPIFFVALAFIILGWVLLPGCSHAKHRSSGGETTVVEDPLFPPDLAPVFWDARFGKITYHKEDVLLLPISLLIPQEILDQAPDYPATLQMGPFFFPMLALEAGLYSTKDQRYELFLLEDTIYTAVPLQVLALLAYDFVLPDDNSQVVLLNARGALVFQPTSRFIAVGGLHLWSVN